MRTGNVTRFEDLSTEIYFEIFDFFSTNELYSSFSNLNHRLNSIVKSSVHLNLITTSYLDPLLSFFNSFRTIQLFFNHANASPLSKYNCSNFHDIRSFFICSTIVSDACFEPIEQIDTFIQPNRCPQLQSLWLPYCSQRLFDWIFQGAFANVKRCHFYRTKHPRIVLSILPNSRLPTLRQLTILDRNGEEFEKILLLCPKLHYFDFSCDSLLPPFIHLTSPYLSLKHLRLSRIRSFLFHNGQFESLLSIFPNLIQMDLTVEQCSAHDENIDFKQVAQYLHHRLPRLKVLEWCIYVPIRHRCSFYRQRFEQISRMHPLFVCLGRVDSLLRIASFDFTSIHHYDRCFIRPSLDEPMGNITRCIVSRCVSSR